MVQIDMTQIKGVVKGRCDDQVIIVCQLPDGSCVDIEVPINLVPSDLACYGKAVWVSAPDDNLTISLREEIGPVFPPDYIKEIDAWLNE